jgi:hypothetical protein
VELYLCTGKNREAVALLKKRPPAWSDYSSARVLFHTRLGLALAQLGRLAEGSHELFKAVSLTEDMRQQAHERSYFLASDVGGGRIRSYRGLTETLSRRAVLGERTDREFAAYGKDIPSNVFYFSELMKARTLLEGLAESARRYTEPELPLDLKEKESDLLNQLQALENKWEETYKEGEEAFTPLVKRKEKLKKELNSLISEIRKKYPRYAALKYPRPILAEELPLKRDEVLLEYIIGDKASYVLRVKRGGVEKVFNIAKGKEELEGIVNEFILPLQNHSMRERFSVPLGKNLYSLLLEEALRDVPPEMDILIVPDGILGLVPFEALVTKAGRDYRDSTYVGDIWKITYSQSAAVLALNRLLKSSQARKPLFALGNPIYEKSDPRYVAYKQGKQEPKLTKQKLSQYAYRSLATRREWGKTTKGDKAAKELVYTPLADTEDEIKGIAKLFNAR